MPILDSERSAAMIAVRDEIVAQAPSEIRDEVRAYLTDAKVLAIANAAMNPLMPRMNLLAERNRDLENQMRGLA